MASTASAGSGFETPESRVYHSDYRFRKFAEILALEPPHIRVRENVDGETGVVTNDIKYEHVPSRPMLDASGAGTKHLKDAFMKYSATRRAWRGTYPSTMCQALSSVGVAPRLHVDDAASIPSTDAARRRSTQDVGLRALMLALFVGVVCLLWPLWNVILDPQSDENHRLLGVPAGASVQDIKRAFRDMAKRGSLKHPDQGGDAAAYMKVRNAYDMLLEQKQKEEEGNGTVGLSEEAKQVTQQVLWFIGFSLGRMSGMLYAGTDFIVRLLKTEDMKMIQGIHFFVHVTCMALFLWESSSSIITTLIAGASSVKSLFGSTAHFTQTRCSPDDAHVDWEAPLYVQYFVVPAAAWYIVTYWAVLDVLSLGRLVLGCVLVACQINRQRPYLFLQWYLQSRACTYGRATDGAGNPSLRSEGFLFLRTVFELLVDDILAYSMQVPASFRIACYTIVLVAVAQRWFYPALAVLPWGSPEKWQQVHQGMVEVVQDLHQNEQKAAASAGAAGDAPPAPRTEKKKTGKEKKEERKQLLQEDKVEETKSSSAVCTNSSTRSYRGGGGGVEGSWGGAKHEGKHNNKQ